jgi:nicotinate phosphoribosyltransferase
VEYAGHGRLKLSTGKAVLPGRKQIFRVEDQGIATHDVLGRSAESLPGRPLLRQVMQHGVRLPEGRVSLNDARACARREMDHLPVPVRGLDPVHPPYRVDLSEGLGADRDRLQRAYAEESL